MTSTLIPHPGLGLLTPGCGHVSDACLAGCVCPNPVPLLRRVGVGLRIGGEASLCWVCGPEGGVYHPADGLSMADVLAVAERLPQAPGYDEPPEGYRPGEPIQTGDGEPYGGLS